MKPIVIIAIVVVCSVITVFSISGILVIESTQHQSNYENFADKNIVYSSPVLIGDYSDDNSYDPQIDLSNCNYTPTQRMMLESIENNDSIDVGVKNQQIIQIMQQACS